MSRICDKGELGHNPTFSFSLQAAALLLQGWNTPQPKDCFKSLFHFTTDLPELTQFSSSERGKPDFLFKICFHNQISSQSRNNRNAVFTFCMWVSESEGNRQADCLQTLFRSLLFAAAAPFGAHLSFWWDYKTFPSRCLELSLKIAIVQSTVDL